MHHEMTAGTIFGTTLAFMATVTSQDIEKTLILTALGAAASFITTMVLKWAIKQIKQWNCKRKGCKNCKCS